MIHRRSKISRLPEPAITQINEFLDANVEYARILDWLREQGHNDLEHYHISRWRDTGYQDWLQAQERQAALDRQLQWAATCPDDSHARLHNAAMNLVVVKLFDAINRLDPADINRLLESKPEKVFTLINSFAHHSRAVVEKDRLKEDLRLTALAEHRAKAPRERLTDEFRRKVFEELRLVLQVPASAIPAPVPESSPSPVNGHQPFSPPLANGAQPFSPSPLNGERAGVRGENALDAEPLPTAQNST